MTLQEIAEDEHAPIWARKAAAELLAALPRGPLAAAGWADRLADAAREDAAARLGVKFK